MSESNSPGNDSSNNKDDIKKSFMNEKLSSLRTKFEAAKTKINEKVEEKKQDPNSFISRIEEKTENFKATNEEDLDKAKGLYNNMKSKFEEKYEKYKGKTPKELKEMAVEKLKSTGPRATERLQEARDKLTFKNTRERFNLLKSKIFMNTLIGAGIGFVAGCALYYKTNKAKTILTYTVSCGLTLGFFSLGLPTAEQAPLIYYDKFQGYAYWKEEIPFWKVKYGVYNE